MSRLIDADALIRQTAELEAVALEQVAKYELSEDPIRWNRWTAILAERTAFKYDFIDAPIVDAVDVVRCKDCKWCRAGYCEKADDIIPFGFAHYEWENFYCAWGERKEDAETN